MERPHSKVDKMDRTCTSAPVDGADVHTSGRLPSQDCLLHAAQHDKGDAQWSSFSLATQPGSGNLPHTWDNLDAREHMPHARTRVCMWHASVVTCGKVWAGTHTHTCVVVVFV